MGGGYSRGPSSGSSYGSYGGGGGGGFPSEEVRQAKAKREAEQFFAYQRRIVRDGMPQPGRGRDEPFWMREEQELFKSAHVSVGIDFKKYDEVAVERVGGTGEEEPISTFQDFIKKFSPPQELIDNIKRCNYQVPTPVQKHSMPAAASGTDVMVCAQTGSGKTAAFLVPTITGVMNAGTPPVTEGPVKPAGLILAPTRELCQQTAFEARRLCFRSSCRVVAVFGGSPVMPQLQQLAEGCDIMVCTPGRLDDFLNRGVVSMEGVKYLVLDEADRMLDMGFEPAIRNIIEENGMPAPGGEDGRRTMMFSATFPKEIQDLATDFLDPAYLWISVGRVGAAAASVEQRFTDVRRVSEQEKFQALLDALNGVKSSEGETAKTIIFANLKSTVADLAYRLGESRIRVAEIHGDLSQFRRDRALQDLKEGRVSVLVATDVAARGLDLPGVDHVVNFEMAKNVDDYVHRIGRTGRMGNNGVATTFVSWDEPAVRDVVSLLKQQSQDVPNWLQDMSWPSGGGGGGGGFRNRAGYASRGGGGGARQGGYRGGGRDYQAP